MAELIKADTRLDAWMNASQYLLTRQGRALNLVLEVESPGTGGTNTSIDRYLRNEHMPTMHSVAETIFPGFEYRRRGLSGVLEFYPEHVYPAIKKHPSISWGTYAYRLVRRQSAHRSRHLNPLEQMIQKMRSELESRGTKRSCYEIGVAFPEYELPLYTPTHDGKRRRGGPCLSHLSFKLLDGAVHLTALYRSHDYCYKVPGNLLGLARLQACIAEVTAQSVGTLVIHSSYAFLGGAKGRFRALLSEIGGSTVEAEAYHVVVQ